MENNKEIIDSEICKVTEIALCLVEQYGEKVALEFLKLTRIYAMVLALRGMEFRVAYSFLEDAASISFLKYGTKI